MYQTNRTQRTMAVFITVLMLTMGLAQAASVSTYSNGQSNVDISLDNPATYSDCVVVTRGINYITNKNLYKRVE